MPFVSVILAAVCNLAAFERQPPASYHVSSCKLNHTCVRLLVMESEAVLLVTAHSSFDWMYQMKLNRKQINRKERKYEKGKKGDKTGIIQERLHVQCMHVGFSQHHFSISARPFPVSYLLILPEMVYTRYDPLFDPPKWGVCLWHLGFESLFIIVFKKLFYWYQFQIRARGFFSLLVKSICGT